jgi:hypothetical protein
MPSDDQIEKVEKLGAYGFVAAWIAAVCSFIYLVVTKDKVVGIRMFITSFWIGMTISNATTFYTGKASSKSGQTYTRKESPIGFYLSSISFAVGSMGIATFLLWKAYTEL